MEEEEPKQIVVESSWIEKIIEGLDIRDRFPMATETTVDKPDEFSLQHFRSYQEAERFYSENKDMKFYEKSMALTGKSGSIILHFRRIYDSQRSAIESILMTAQCKEKNIFFNSGLLFDKNNAYLCSFIDHTQIPKNIEKFGIVDYTKVHGLDLGLEPGIMTNASERSDKLVENIKKLYDGIQ
jgi:hypothetical protein